MTFGSGPRVRGPVIGGARTMPAVRPARNRSTRPKSPSTPDVGIWFPFDASTHTFRQPIPRPLTLGHQLDRLWRHLHGARPGGRALRNTSRGLQQRLAERCRTLGPGAPPTPLRHRRSPSPWPSGLLAFTDETGLNALVAFSAYLALCSIGLSLWAEHRGQSNLYLSAGFVCGTGALFLVHQGAGMTAGVLGTAWVLGKRRWQRGRPLPQRSRRSAENS